MNRGSFKLFAAAVVCLALAANVRAQSQQDDEPSASGIKWIIGPKKVALGTIAQVDLPAGYRFADKQNVGKFMELCQNPVDGNELGAVLSPRAKSESEEPWFVIFSYRDIGYVKDDEKANLDEDAVQTILTSIKKGTEESNVDRKRRGWPTMTIVGWQQKPFFDDETKNLTWSIRAVSEGDEVTNYDGRILGRKGVITATMVCSPNQVAAIVPSYRALVKTVEYNAGEKYSEFRSGDKIAKYGLVGLITGGTAVVVAKSWKAIGKVLIFVFAGIVAFIKKIWGKITGTAQSA